MRSEISASANKIWPNGDNKVPSEYKVAFQESQGWDLESGSGNPSAYPGESVSLQGIWYDLGNINKGFDNNGDFIPDYNVFMQPVGDPSGFDPDCFRLVKTYGVVVIKLKGGGEKVISFVDQNYFENIPENTGGVGLVYYQFIVLNGPCASSLSPYQEVASGRDNEKFNGDYGAPLPFATSLSPSVDFTKSVDQTQVASLPENLTYTLSFTNSGSITVGLTGNSAPLVVKDAIPSGTNYIAGSAASSNVLPSGITAYKILYSTDDGATWSSTEPVTASDVTDLQWWLDADLAAGTTGSVTFQAEVPASISSSAVTNIGSLSFGDTAPFAQDTVSSLLPGINSIGDGVWADNGGISGIIGNGTQDGDEAGIQNVTVSLYFDVNGDGALDDGDILWATDDTDVNGDYGFTSLPDGNYLVIVDTDDISAGWGATSPTLVAVPLDVANASGTAVVVSDTDFGFTPPLSLSKTENSGGTISEDSTVSYTLSVTNNLVASNGSSPSFNYVESSCTYAGSWLTISSPTTLSLADDALSASIPLTGFNFAFYGNSVSEMIVSSNGLVSFATPGDDGYPLGALPNASYDQTIAFLWGDLDPSAQGTISYGYSGSAPNRVMVLEFLNVGHYTNSPSQVTVQCQLFEGTGEVRIVTTSQLNTATAHTVGLQKDISTYYLVSGRNNQVWTTSNECLSLTYDNGAFDPALSLNPVPLYDDYNPAELEFISASPSPSAVNTSTGLISWNNVGPVNPGITESVTLTFKALSDGSNTSVTADNEARVVDPKFANGIAANNDTSTATITVAATGSLSGYIWNDGDGDGWIGANGSEVGESLLAGVTVTLHACSSVANNGSCNTTETTTTTTTDTNGAYSFEGLLPSMHYYVSVATASLPGSSLTQYGDPDDDPTNGSGNGGTCGNGGANAGCDDAWDNDADWFQVGTDSWGSESWELTNINFGYLVPPALSGTLWEDIDGDGSQDSGDEGINSATLELQSAGCTPSVDCPTTTTDANGYYQFEDLTAGTAYTVVVSSATLPSGSSWAETFESDATTNNAISVTLSSGEMANSNDFAFTPSGTSTIGDTLFLDWNGDGTRNTIDEGLANITVSIYRDVDDDGQYSPGTDIFLSSTSTDANGAYSFPNLPASDYLVVVDEDDTDFPASNQSYDPDETMVCSSCDATASLSADGSADNLTGDFGYQPYGNASIGDIIWYDVNGDSTKLGVSEVGLPNIKVYLYADLNGDGAYVLVDSTESDANGAYEFANLPDGTYRVNLDTSDSDIPTDDAGNNYNLTTTSQHEIVIASGSVSTLNGVACGGDCSGDLDFGLAKLGTIGDMLFWDANGNGTQDWNEGGIADVTVNLYDDDAALVASTVTSDGSGSQPAGWYQFTGIMPDTFSVRVASADPDLVGASQTADPESDGLSCDDLSLTTACDNEAEVIIRYGTNFTGADFGYQPPGVIGDFVWFDANDDGVQDEGEPGLADVKIYLCNAPGPCNTANALDSVSTDFDGQYSFSNIADGAYAITAVAPASMSITSGSESIGTLTTSVTLSSGVVSNIGGVGCSDCDNDLDYGFALSGSFSVSGTVCLDDNLADGVCTGVGGESAQNEAVLYLYNDAGDYLGSTTTDPSGNYTFTNLPNDGYYVSLSKASPTLSSSSLTTENADVPGGSITESSLSVYQPITISGASISNADFAFVVDATLDFGDLPVAYSGITDLSQDGARHIISGSPSLYLGTAPDTEVDSGPASGAGTDGADEDGLTFVSPEAWSDGTTGSGNGGSIQVDVTGSGYLVGWMDFNGDGDFTDSAEMVVSQAVTTGISSISFGIPAGTFSSGAKTIYSRFRLFASEPGLPALSFSGAATDGEIEDHSFVAGVPLPVELIEFVGERKANSSLLKWVVDQSDDLDYYELSRSIDGKLFVPITTVEPQQGEQLVSYEWLDKEARIISSKNTLYYQLQSHHIDGTYSKSQVIELNWSKSADLAIAVFPNPADTKTNLWINTSLSSPMEIRIFDAQARLVSVQRIDNPEESYQLNIVTENWAKGLYIIEVRQKGMRKVARLIVE